MLICFNTTQTLLNIDLYTPFNFDDLLEEKNEEYKKELDKAKQRVTNVVNMCWQKDISH